METIKYGTLIILKSIPNHLQSFDFLQMVLTKLSTYLLLWEKFVKRLRLDHFKLTKIIFLIGDCEPKCILCFSHSFEQKGCLFHIFFMNLEVAVAGP